MNRLLYILLILGLSQSLSAQTTESSPKDDREKKEDEKPKKEKVSDRWYFGGNIGLQFGDVMMINISPLVGYRLTEEFSVGLGPRYTYLRIKDQFDTYKYSLYGGSVFTRYEILPTVFLQLEDELLTAREVNPYGTKNGPWINSIMAGAGLTQPLGGSGAIVINAMYILNYDVNNSYYPSPLILRMGFFF